MVYMHARVEIYAENDSILYEHELTWVDKAERYDGTNGLRWAKMAPDSDYVVIGYSSNGSGNNQGVWSYPVATVTVVGGTQLAETRGHSDVGFNQANEQVLVQWENYNSGISYLC